MSQENMWKIGHPELYVSTVEIISVIKWGNEQTDRHTEIWNYLELMYKHPRNVSKMFQKDISSRTKDIKQFS